MLGIGVRTREHVHIFMHACDDDVYKCLPSENQSWQTRLRETVASTIRAQAQRTYVRPWYTTPRKKLYTKMYVHPIIHGQISLSLFLMRRLSSSDGAARIFTSGQLRHWHNTKKKTNTPPPHTDNTYQNNVSSGHTHKHIYMYHVHALV